MNWHGCRGSLLPRAFVAVFLLALLSVARPGDVLAQQAAPMWGTVPLQSNHNFTYFPDPVSACQYQHQSGSPLTPFYGATPYLGMWKAYICQWPTRIGFSNPTTVQLACVDSSGNVAIGVKLVPPGNCVPQFDPNVSRPCNCGYNKDANVNPTAGDPVIVSTGGLYERVTDYADGDGRLTIARTHRSSVSLGSQTAPTYANPYGLGDLWRLSFQWELPLDSSFFSSDMERPVK